MLPSGQLSRPPWPPESARWRHGRGHLPRQRRHNSAHSPLRRHSLARRRVKRNIPTLSQQSQTRPSGHPAAHHNRRPNLTRGVDALGTRRVIFADEESMVTQKYNTAGRQLLDQARAELYQGDIRQASEKGWGAAAQMVKAVAKSRGWPHRHHGLLTPPIETPCRRNQRLRPGRPVRQRTKANTFPAGPDGLHHLPS